MANSGASPTSRNPQTSSNRSSPRSRRSDKVKIAELILKLKSGPLDRLFDEPEVETIDYLTEHGFSETVIEKFFRPFFGGVFHDRELRKSSRMFRFRRMFAEGDASIPARGMGQIPRNSRRD